MWDDPKDAIETAIRSAFVSYPKDDDPDGRMHWVGPKKCSQLAIALIIGLQAKGFEIVRQDAQGHCGREDLSEQAHEKIHPRRKPQTFSEAACRNDRSQKTAVAIEPD